MNSCSTDIFFGNYYHLQSVRFELNENGGDRDIRQPHTQILYSYPPKGRWIVVDIYRDAKRRSIYPPLYPEGDIVLVFTKSDG